MIHLHGPSCPFDDFRDNNLPFTDYKGEDLYAPPRLESLGFYKDYNDPIALFTFNQQSFYMYNKSFIIGRTRNPISTEVDLNILYTTISKIHILVSATKTNNFYGQSNFTFKFKSLGKHGFFIDNNHYTTNTYFLTTSSNKNVTTIKVGNLLKHEPFIITFEPLIDL